jgi:glycosyltransferase involved in cell wall biosynthesis
MTAFAPDATFTTNVIPLYVEPAERPASVAIVVPCYDEAARLDLPAFSSYLCANPWVRFVFVNDGSKDDTLGVLDRLHAQHPDRIEVLSLTRNSGKAEAVRMGLAYAALTGCDFLGYWDADLATPLDAIGDFLRICRRYDDVEVVYGARLQLLGHRVARTLTRRIISRICARMARVAVGLPIGDTQCGAKLMRMSPRLAHALSEPFSAGWLFDVELFSRIADTASCQSRAFYEYPLPEWTEVPCSKVTGRAIRREGFAMLRLIAERKLGLRARTPRQAPAGLQVHRSLVVALEQAA